MTFWAYESGQATKYAEQPLTAHHSYTIGVGWMELTSVGVTLLGAVNI